VPPKHARQGRPLIRAEPEFRIGGDGAEDVGQSGAVSRHELHLFFCGSGVQAGFSDLRYAVSFFP
jgi:hypothetical protein